MADYKFEQLTPERFDVLIPLMKDAFGMDVNLDYFRWKFLDNPAGFVMAYYALSDTDEPASYNGLIPEWYTVDGKQVRIFQTCDVMTHSRHRRKGLFEKVIKLADEQLRNTNELFTIGFGSVASTPVLCKTGRRVLFDIYYHFKPAISSKLELLFGFGKNGKETSVEKIPVSEIENLLPLIQKGGEATRVAKTRNLEFVKWRLSNPLHKYQIAALKNKGVYTAYTIYYFDSGKLMLFDFYADSRDAERKMMRMLNNEIVTNKLQGMVSFGQLGIWYSKRLLRNGFWVNKTGKGPMSARLNFLLYASDDLQQKFSGPAAWSAMPFDHDSF